MLLFCSFTYYESANGYAFQIGRKNFYEEYGVIVNQSYSGSFYEHIDKGVVHFANTNKKIIFSSYKEKGISDRVSFITKKEVLNINSKIKIFRIHDANDQGDHQILHYDTQKFIKKDLQSNNKNPNHLGNKSFEGNINYTIMYSEFGYRFLFWQHNNHFLSGDIFMISKFKTNQNNRDMIPLLRFGVYYGKKFEYRFLNNSFLEIGFSHQKSYFHKNELFSSINYGLLLHKRLLAIFTFERNSISQQSPETKRLSNILKKHSGINHHNKAKIFKKIDDCIFIDKKINERKYGIKLIYNIKGSNYLSLEYTTRMTRYNKLNYIKMSFIRKTDFF